MLQRHLRLSLSLDRRHFVISWGTLCHHAVGKPINALDGSRICDKPCVQGCLNTGTLGRTAMLSVNRFRALGVRNASIEALYLRTRRERIDKFRNILNPKAWGHLNPSSYCDVGRLFYGVFKLWSKLQRKNEEIISRNSLPHYKRASSFTNKREAA